LSRSNSLAEAARRDAASNLAVARTRLDESAARARIARDSIVPMATRLRQSAVRLFEAGQTGALPVFEAFRQEREAIHDALQDVRQFQEARANALALLGRWS
jgi:outer membrane protein TolC